MNYPEVIDYLYHATPAFERVGASAYKPGLQTTMAIDQHDGQPHRHYKIIHVAGTNGKGSVSHSLASILQEAGLRVGLYTSPHLVDFRERMRVNGKCISEEYVVRYVEEFIEWNKQAQLSPSFFELTTGMAFRFFADEQVDVAVIEVGLGGRLDSTNIVTPVLSVITNIAFDHTQFLGNTLGLIAAEKAGIIKPHVPVVVGETTPETRPVFLQKARECSAPIVFAEDEDVAPLPDFELKGYYQERNLRTILCAARELSRQGLLPADMDRQRLEHALQHVSTNTGLMGRWQTLQTAPLVVCDTGHNPAAWVYLAPQIKAQSCHTLRIVFGMVDDKDIGQVLTMLPATATYYFTQASTHRAIPAAQVALLAADHGLHGQAFDDVATAYHAALADASPSDFIFVGGSSYVVADLLTALTHS